MKLGLSCHYYYFCIRLHIRIIMTKTAIIRFDSDNLAVRKIIEGLESMGIIKIEEYPYNQTMVDKIMRGEQAIREGKGIAVNPDDLWK